MPAPLKSYIDRVLNVLAEIDDKQSDKKAIYKEIAGDGYDRTVVAQVVGHIRKKAAKPGKVEEQSQLFDLYLADYEGLGTFVATHAAREPVDEDGVVTEHEDRKAGDKIAAAERTSARRARAASAESAAKVDLKISEPGTPAGKAAVAPVAVASHSAPEADGEAVDAAAAPTGEVVPPISPETIQAEVADEALEPLELEGSDPLRSATATRKDAAPAAPVAPDSPSGDAAEGTGGGVPLSLVPALYAAPGEVVMERTPPRGIVAHPYAACWPVNNIDVTGGVREPIVKIEQFILDGRGRYFAARDAGIEYPVVQYDGTDPLLDCIRWNLASRPGRGEWLRIVLHKLCKLEPGRADEIEALFGLDAAREAAE